MFWEEEIYIWIDKRLIRLACRDIVLVEAEDNYVKIHTIAAGSPFLVRASLYKVSRIFTPDLFYRVHRCYIVGLYHVKFFTKDTVNLGNKEVPLARDRAPGLNDRFVVLGVFWRKK
jgi:DNA-binding LytR/AlgR family response regulator